MIKAQKLVLAERLAGEGNKKLKITLKDGSVITGHSWGIESAIDDDGDDLDYDVLAFKKDDGSNLIWIKDDDIENVELA